jgi:thioesterase domain-containing protein
VQSRGPYHIGGWCAAGPVAVETARQLREASQEVAVVVLFDSWRPGYAAELASTPNPHMTMKSALRRRYRFHRMMLERLTSIDKAKYLWNAVASKLRSSRNKFYLRHWAIAERLFTRFGLPLPHFMHNVSLKTLDSVKDYKPRPYVGNMTLIRAVEAPYVPQAHPSCGWNSVVQGEVEVFFTPGTHESMFLEPNLSALGEILQNCLERAARPVQRTNLGQPLSLSTASGIYLHGDA